YLNGRCRAGDERESTLRYSASVGGANPFDIASGADGPSPPAAGRLTAPGVLVGWASNPGPCGPGLERRASPRRAFGRVRSGRGLVFIWPLVSLHGIFLRVTAVRARPVGSAPRWAVAAGDDTNAPRGASTVWGLIGWLVAGSACLVAAGLAVATYA